MNSYFQKEFKEFAECIRNNSWYSKSIRDILRRGFRSRSQWDCTLEFMDALIEWFEECKISDEIVIIQARFGLPDSRRLDTRLPTIEEAKQQTTSCGSILAFPFKIATILQSLEHYRSPIWIRSPRYQSMKLFTYYECLCIGEDWEIEGRPIMYSRSIVRFYSQKWYQGNSPNILFP